MTFPASEWLVLTRNFVAGSHPQNDTKHAGLLPRAIANAFKQRRQQVVLNELEVERLDRIRHPEKYRGR